MERKIFNFDSKILIEKTIKKYGYNPDSLGDSSAKFIVCSCRFCGKDHDIRKGFFLKSGSACHKDCKILEMKLQKSPFSREDVRKKSEKTNILKYGVKHASSNREIAKKISDTKKTEEFKNRNIKNLQVKYGVDNVFQLEEIKDRIKDTNIKKYGVDHPMKNTNIKNKMKKTLQKKYGIDNILKDKYTKEKIKKTNEEKYGYINPMQNSGIQLKSIVNRSISIKNNDGGNYNLINILRNNEFWDKMKEERYTLKELCNEYNLNYGSLTARLLDKEFYNKYYQYYSFPKQQKQKEIFNILNNLGLNVIMNDRSIIHPLELDIYIPDKKMAIEFNGSYWHSEACLTSLDARKKHIFKLNKCRDKGIRLFNIFENLWDNRKKQYLNLLKSFLGLNTIKVGARKCYIDYEECKGFYDENHIQGYGRRTIKFFNLIYNNEIVGSMSASSHHRQNASSDTIVLNRLCYRDDYNIQGGSSKLFNCFIEWSRNSNYSKIISFSDNCWTDGNIYKILNFNFIKEYSPDYFYWDIKNKNYRSKQSQRKKATKCPIGMTEKEWCEERGLYRIYDCGKKLWEYNLR